jgi:dihydrofolate synthase/folylpolyglutamate synthase
LSFVVKKEVQVVPQLSSADPYEVALGELLKLEFFGMKLGLQNITELMEFLGHPERTYQTIHVAGTNGKGSVSAMLASIFQVSGKRVGLYTSPHLVSFRERMRVNGDMVPEAFIREFLSRIWPKVLELKATFFEVTTAMAFEYFKDAQVDIAIIETGLGGRLDSTNILEHPLATVITSIGWDHMKQLGNSLEEIAWEKAGIFKAGVPAIVNAPFSLHNVFLDRADEVGCSVDFISGEEDIHFTPPLAGPHQRQNLRTVLATLAHIENAPTAEQISQGLSEVRMRTGFRARLEPYANARSRAKGISIVLDVGHNLDAVQQVKAEFQSCGVTPIVVVGLMKDKDISAVLREFGEFAKPFITVQAPTERAMASYELYKQAMSAGLPAIDGGSVLQGVEIAMGLAVSGDTILIAGSHYVVGEFLANETSDAPVL